MEGKLPSKPKLVVRMLPPKLGEAEFRQSIADWADAIDWSFYEAGHTPEEPGRPIRFGCCYLRFTTQEAAAAFSEKHDGAPYRDSTGGMCRCLIELAVCQRIPSEGRGKPDARVGTILKDAEYLKFVAELEAEKPPPPSAEAMLEAREKEESAETRGRRRRDALDEVQQAGRQAKAKEKARSRSGRRRAARAAGQADRRARRQAPPAGEQAQESEQQQQQQTQTAEAEAAAAAAGAAQRLRPFSAAASGAMAAISARRQEGVPRARRPPPTVRWSWWGPDGERGQGTGDWRGTPTGSRRSR